MKQAKETRRGKSPEASALLDNAMKGLNNRLYKERLVPYRARANQDLIANPTCIDSKLAQILGFASMGDGPPTDGSKHLLKRLTDGISERSVAVDGVEKVEKKVMAALTNLAISMLKE